MMISGPLSKSPLPDWDRGIDNSPAYFTTRSPQFMSSSVANIFSDGSAADGLDHVDRARSSATGSGRGGVMGSCVQSEPMEETGEADDSAAGDSPRAVDDGGATTAAVATTGSVSPVCIISSARKAKSPSDLESSVSKSGNSKSDVLSSPESPGTEFDSGGGQRRTKRWLWAGSEIGGGSAVDPDETTVRGSGDVEYAGYY
eukprot:SAG31_NODE_1306_length_8889_cov_17.337315_4_plen_201_part_00